MRDSAFKRTLRELPVGSEVEVEPPKGRFSLPEDPYRPLVFVAGGNRDHRLSEHALLHQRGAASCRVTPIYSNRDRESTAFLDELRELEQALPDFFSVVRFVGANGLRCS